MKVTLVGQEPLFIDNQKGQELMQLVARGVEYVVIDGNMYKTSTVTAIKAGNKPDFVQIGASPRLTRLEDRREDPTGDGYKKFLALKRSLLG